MLPKVLFDFGRLSDEELTALDEISHSAAGPMSVGLVNAVKRERVLRREGKHVRDFELSVVPMENDPNREARIFTGARDQHGGDSALGTLLNQILIVVSDAGSAKAKPKSE